MRKETNTKSKKRKANSSVEPKNKKMKTSTRPRNKKKTMPNKKKKIIRDEFIGSLDSAIKMLRDNCNLLEHMTELNKTPFRHIFHLITKMKGKEDISWCKRYNNCMRQIVDSYNVKKKTIRVGEMEVEISVDKVRAAFGIVDGSIKIDIDKKKIDETEDGKDFISRCFPEKKRIVMVAPKKDKEPNEDENESENDKEERDEQKVPKVCVETILGWDLYKKLMENKLSSSDFARVATLYLLTWVFTPTLGFSCALRNLHFVGNMEKICSYNWSRVILDLLNKGLERNKESGTKSGCVILLAYCLCEETKLIQPLNTSFPRFARWDLKQLHAALKKTKLIDVDPEMVVDYIEPSEEEQRLLHGEMPEEGIILLEWYGAASRDSKKNRGGNDVIFKDVDETVAKAINTSYESEIAKLKRELEASKEEKESMNKINEELKRENKSLRSENTLLALQLEEYKTCLMEKE